MLIPTEVETESWLSGNRTLVEDGIEIGFQLLWPGALLWFVKVVGLNP